MPELPEVETVCRSLRQCIEGRTINEVTVRLPKIIHHLDAACFSQELQGSRIVAVRRRGKYILLNLETKPEQKPEEALVLVVHLRMTGKLLYESHRQELQKHVHVIFALDNGYDLRYDDTRQFGTMSLVQQQALSQMSGLAALGLEPVDADFTLAAFQQVLMGKKQRAKVFLLDQRFVAGIGNIYADEILFQAGIHPEESVCNLSEAEVAKLWFAIGDRLREAIACGGSSIKDYVDGFGQAGSFQNYHKVYGRGGQPCIECGSTLEKIKICGRASCFCPNCQPRKKTE